jgi:hypothetical protein
MDTFKNIILWRYERASWQWDLLCVLILVFIFLTPKSWFDRRDDLQPKREREASKSMIFRPHSNEQIALIYQNGRIFVNRDG